MSEMLMATAHGAVGDGTSAGTLAAIDVTIGFKPKYVKVFVVDTNCVSTEWTEGMAAAKGIQLKDASGFKLTELSANGITVSARGFTIGTSCQTASKKYHWIALG